MRIEVKDNLPPRTFLKAALLKAQTKLPGNEVVKELQKQNDTLIEKVAVIIEKMIKDNNEANSKITLVMNSLSHIPPSS